jgi:hypothetical protein
MRRRLFTNDVRSNHQQRVLDVQGSPSLLAKLEKMAAADNCQRADFLLVLIENEWERRRTSKEDRDNA